MQNVCQNQIINSNHSLKHIKIKDCVNINTNRLEKRRFNYKIRNTMQEIKDTKALEQLTIDQLFEVQNLAVFQMFRIPQIHKRLKSNIKKFSDFLKSNEGFLFEMINIGIKLPIHQSKDQKMKQVCFIALDILTQDYDCIIDLFIKEDLEEIVQEEQVYGNIKKNQDTGELVIQDIQIEQQQTEQSMFQEKYKYLYELLRYLDCSQINQSCLNYMVAVLDSIIKKNAETLMKFFSVKKNFLDKLIQLAYYPSVSQMLVKMISDQDKTKQYRYRPMKISIVQGVGDYMRKHINDDWYFQGYLEFIDKVFDSTKSTYQENVDDFKDIADSLVSSNHIQFYLQTLIKVDQQNIANNCLLFLNKAIRRRNYDEQMDDYDRQNFPIADHKKPTNTMNFQLGILYNFMQQLIVNYSKNIRNYSNLTRMNFYQVLNLLTKHSQFKQKMAELKPNILEILLTLLENIQNESKNGLVKFYIQNLFQKYIIVSQLTGKQTSQLIQKIQGIMRTYKKFEMIDENTNEQQQKKTRNKDQNKPFYTKIQLLIENLRQIVEERDKNNPQQIYLKEVKSTQDLYKIRQIYSMKINDLCPSKHKKKCFSFIEYPNGRQIAPLQYPIKDKLVNIQKLQTPIDSPTKRALNMQKFDRKIQQRKVQAQKAKQQKLLQFPQGNQQGSQKQLVQQQRQLLKEINGIIVKKVQSKEEHIILQIGSKKSEEISDSKQNQQIKQTIQQQQLQANQNDAKQNNQAQDTLEKKQNVQKQTNKQSTISHDETKQERAALAQL